MSMMAVAVLFPLILLVSHPSILRGHEHLMGLLHLEEHWRGGAVFHGPEITERGRTILGSQNYNVWVEILCCKS